MNYLINFKLCLIITLSSFLFAHPLFAEKSHSLTSSKVSSPPTVDGNSNEPQWNKAKKLKLEAEDGPTITIQSVYTETDVFFLLQWKDSTESVRPDQWIFDGDKWSVRQELRWEDEDPWDADNDMIGFQWPINNSIPDFNEKGCKKICHAPEKEDRMFTNNPGEISDIWLWKAGLTNPLEYADSYYLDHTVLLKKDEPEKIKRLNAAHKEDDPGPGKLNFIRNLSEGKPKWTPEGGPNNDLFLLKGNEAPFDRSKVRKGDTVPGWLLARPKGSRGTINAAGKYYKETSKWILEISRKLITKDKDHDVQFTDLNRPYYFGLAVWDNEKLQGHTRVKKPVGLRFDVP